MQSPGRRFHDSLPLPPRAFLATRERLLRASQSLLPSSSSRNLANPSDTPIASPSSSEGLDLPRTRSLHLKQAEKLSSPHPLSGMRGPAPSCQRTPVLAWQCQVGLTPAGGHLAYTILASRNRKSRANGRN